MSKRVLIGSAIIILFIVLIFFSSCFEAVHPGTGIARGNRVDFMKSKGFGSSHTFEVDKFRYKNHDYLYFSEGHGIAIVHDPDCDCRKED